VAGQQLGVITTQQLYAAGLSRDAIQTRRQRGTLHLVHRGVYLFGGSAPASGALELAAAMACGPGALVSHRSAAALWGLTSSMPKDGVDVTVGGNHRDRPGVRIHRVADLDPGDRRLCRGIPVTSPARALLDFASQAEPDGLEQAIAEAYALRLTNEVELRQQLERLPYRPGAGLLRAELDRQEGPATAARRRSGA
jgi:predicted transcriptional regulator of viral defense system